MKKKIFAAGVLAFDTLETPYGKREMIVGGSANCFVIAASIFTEVELSAIIGQDFPEEHIKLLNKRGVGTSNVSKTNGKTFHWIAKYQGTMAEAETLDTHLNVLPDYVPTADKCAKECEMLFLAALTPAKQKEVMGKVDTASMIFCDTKDLWIKLFPQEVKEVIKQVDVLFINEQEARDITGKTNIIKAMHELASWGPKTVILKRGEYGSLLYREGEKIFYVPAYPVKEVVDPTGAGDTFAGGFVGYLATSPDCNKFSEMKKAMLYGCAAASFVVEGFGAEVIVNVTKKDLQHRYDELVSMMRIE